jgi:hypothetical protein
MTVHEPKRPKAKASRAEKQLRSTGRGLWVVSMTLLVACMTMSGVYGWSQGSTLLNAAIFAGGLAASDVAGAFIARFCGTCTAIKDKPAAVVGFFLAALCFAVTFSGVVGFYGTNREALAVHREQSTKLDTSQLDWLRSQTVTAPSKDKATMLNEIKEQMKAMQARGVEAAVSDGLSAVMAPVIGAAEGDTRRKSILAIAAAVLLIQFGTSWAYGYTRQRLEPVVAARAMANDRQFAGVKTSNDDKNHVFTKMAAREDLNSLMAADGLDLNKRGVFSLLSRRWGWNDHKTKRFLYSQSDLVALLPPRNRHGTNVIALNGNGRVHQ